VSGRTVFSLVFAIAAVACARQAPPPDNPPLPPTPPTLPVASESPPAVATAAPDSGTEGPSLDARKRRALDILQGKVPESELKVDSVGE
jgi:hypothetical protein